MCSRNDEEDGSQSCMEEKAKPMWTEICQKCSLEKPVIQILQIKHAYCRNCFLGHINHKFRSTLGKSKMMKPTDVVMTAFSGSVKSHVLLHLLHAGFSEKSHKRFLFKVKVLYIDEGAVLGISLPERTANLRLIADLLETYGFSAHFTSLSSIHDTKGPWCFPLTKTCTLNINEKLENDLKHMFDNISSLTAKEDLLNQFRKQILLRSAKELKCGKIFTANTSTDLAIQILTDVSLGRGSQMHHDVTFCDDRDEDVKILRPLLELSSKESTFYSVYYNLSSVFVPSLSTMAASDCSIHNLSEQFVMELMQNFPSTVSTVFRTGEKLGSATSASLSDDENDVCLLCQVKIDSNVASCSSAQATEFSRLISSLGPCGFDNKTLTRLFPSEGQNSSCVNPKKSSTSCCSELDVPCDCKTDRETPTLSDIEGWCCYGCRRILHELKSPTDLPKSIIESARMRKGLQSMRNSIQDFLL